MVRFAVATLFLTFPLGAAELAVDFNRDIRPILSDKCFTCHGPDAANRMTPLRFDTEAGARIAIAPGAPEKSSLIQRVTSENKTLRMPPASAGKDKLPEHDIQLLRRWVEQGAKWQSHWSFSAPRRPAIPPVSNPAWPRNPIDQIVLARLDREGLKPSPEASRETWIRRATLDLTGLPPTPPEVDAFVADRSPQAYDRVVDRLFASPRYAERMAIRWLEAARYADTNGYQSDGERSMWRWRDWVIDAFRRNMPFDQFTIEQIAGDLLPSATRDQKIASAFHRNHRTNAEGGIVEEEFRVEYVADRVETTSTVWLGLTFGCARCHDHKYDPMKQKEFYQLFAYFNHVPERGLVYNFGNEEPYIQAPTPDQEEKLAALDRKVAAAEQRFAELQPQLEKSQAAWEKRLRKSPPLHWTVGPALAGPPEGLEFAKFNYMDPWSFSVRINPAAPDGAILSRMEDYREGEGYGLFLKDGRIRLVVTRRYTDISLRLETVKPVTLNRWQHVAVTYDGYRKGSGVKIYVDGVPQEIRIEFDELTYPYGPKEPFRIGSGGGLRFQGQIEEVRAYKLALTSEQASTLFLREPMNDLARIEQRTPAQSAKLRLSFLDQAAPVEIRQAYQAMLDARIERRKYSDSIPTVMVMVESPTPRDTFVLKRGAYDAPGEKVSPAVPAFLPPLPKDQPNNRLGLARWLVSRDNPLTARVAVNRFWQMLFGTGLVKTVEDFGAQGERPIQPELLDWLAVEFMDSGWNTQSLLRTIVTSATYAQQSKVTPELISRDPENRLFARGPRQRLAPEMIRDQALAISGLLVEKAGGPSVKPYQPPGLWQELTGGGGYRAGKGDDLYRRTLYTYWKRTIAPPSMVTFDSPTRETCIVRESRTNTPLQALNLMNDVAYLEAARKLGERMLREGGADPVGYAFRLALARPPKPSESQLLAGALAKFRAHFSTDPDVALEYLAQGESARDAAIDPQQLAAFASLASVILNLDETVTKQ